MRYRHCFSTLHDTRRVQVNQDGLKLNSAHQLLVDADGINVLGGSVRTMQKNTEALVVASKDIGLEVNADRTKCMVIVSRSECRTKSQYGDW